MLSDTTLCNLGAKKKTYNNNDNDNDNDNDNKQHNRHTTTQGRTTQHKTMQHNARERNCTTQDNTAQHSTTTQPIISNHGTAVQQCKKPPPRYKCSLKNGVEHLQWTAVSSMVDGETSVRYGEFIWVEPSELELFT